MLCPTCGHKIANGTEKKPNEVPCTEYHVRCIQCEWPVAKSLMKADGICEVCKGYEARQKLREKEKEKRIRHEMGIHHNGCSLVLINE